MNKAIITGVSGQSGSYLAELLISKGYAVVGVVRRTSQNSLANLANAKKSPNLILEEGDITDYSSIIRILNKHPEAREFYNLAAQSVAEESFLPVKIGNKVKYRTFKDIWGSLSSKHSIRTEDFNGTEIEVIDISPTKNSIMALGYSNSSGNWYNITQISRHKWDGKMAKMSQKFGSVCVTPNHSLIDIYGKVCEPESNPWMLNVRKINHIVKKPMSHINTKLKHKDTIEDEFFYYSNSDRGTPGKVSKTIEVNVLCKFIGAFVSEGHTTYNKANGNYYVGISNSNIEWLKEIEVCLNQFYNGNYCYITHKKDGYKNIYELQIKSAYLYRLLELWCGKGAKNKRLPEWFTSISDNDSKTLLKYLIDGDGSWTNDGWRYTTSSYELACHMSWLFTKCGHDYTFNDADGYFHFRSCKFYQLDQGVSGKKIEWIDYNGWVYDITVQEVHNFTVGIGNIVVHNSHVATSFTQPGLTWDVTGKGCMNILQAILDLGLHNSIRFYQASSSEMFGKSYDLRNKWKNEQDYLRLVRSNEPLEEMYQDENTKFLPQSPYAISKCAAHYATRLYREAYGMHASCGILMNHESPRRGELFVTRKITKWIGQYLKWLKSNGITNDLISSLSKNGDILFASGIVESFPKLRLGNLDASRDWGSAKDFVEAMHTMLQQSTPDDYVICTEETHTVREFLDEAFAVAGISDWTNLVFIDPQFYRPAEVDYLRGDCSKARKKFGWAPKTSFKELVREMTVHDIENA